MDREETLKLIREEIARNEIDKNIEEMERCKLSLIQSMQMLQYINKPACLENIKIEEL